MAGNNRLGAEFPSSDDENNNHFDVENQEPKEKFLLDDIIATAKTTSLKDAESEGSASLPEEDNGVDEEERLRSADANDNADEAERSVDENDSAEEVENSADEYHSIDEVEGSADENGDEDEVPTLVKTIKEEPASEDPIYEDSTLKEPEKPVLEEVEEENANLIERPQSPTRPKSPGASIVHCLAGIHDLPDFLTPTKLTPRATGQKSQIGYASEYKRTLNMGQQTEPENDASSSIQGYVLGTIGDEDECKSAPSQGENFVYLISPNRQASPTSESDNEKLSAEKETDEESDYDNDHYDNPTLVNLQEESTENDEENKINTTALVEESSGFDPVNESSDPTLSTIVEVEEDENIEPEIQDDENVEPEVQHDEIVEPKVQDDENAEPQLQDDENVEPQVQDDENVEPQVQDDENVELQVQNDGNVEPQVQEDENVKPQVEDNENIEPQVLDEENTEPEAQVATTSTESPIADKKTSRSVYRSSTVIVRGTKKSEAAAAKMATLKLQKEQGASCTVSKKKTVDPKPKSRVDLAGSSILDQISNWDRGVVESDSTSGNGNVEPGPRIPKAKNPHTVPSKIQRKHSEPIIEPERLTASGGTKQSTTNTRHSRTISSSAAILQPRWSTATSFSGRQSTVPVGNQKTIALRGRVQKNGVACGSVSGVETSAKSGATHSASGTYVEKSRARKCFTDEASAAKPKTGTKPSTSRPITQPLTAASRRKEKDEKEKARPTTATSVSGSESKTPIRRWR